MNVLITGASGFIGRTLCDELLRRGHAVVPAVRRERGMANERIVGELGPGTSWRDTLRNMQAVVHLAARVHVMRDTSSDPLAAFRTVNTEGTLNLARQCAEAGVKRFVFASSVKVNGEGRESPYRETDLPMPEDAYAVSKWEAEQGLREIELETGMGVVILRPPLVYGPGVGANFARLMRMVELGVPLPLAMIENRRSLLFVGNLSEAIARCLIHPEAVGQTFLLDDGMPVSTPDLIRALALSMHRPARLMPMPRGALEFFGRLLGKGAAVARLTGSLYVDSSEIQSRLSWTQPYTLALGLAATIKG